MGRRAVLSWIAVALVAGACTGSGQTDVTTAILQPDGARPAFANPDEAAIDAARANDPDLENPKVSRMIAIYADAVTVDLRVQVVLVRIPTCRRLPRCLFCSHDSILVSKARSLQLSQGDSLSVYAKRSGPHRGCIRHSARIRVREVMVSSRLKRDHPYVAAAGAGFNLFGSVAATIDSVRRLFGFVYVSVMGEVHN